MKEVWGFSDRGFVETIAKSIPEIMANIVEVNGSRENYTKEISI